MPVTLSVLSPSAGEVKLRYQEPYVTEGLNAKFAVVVPRGTIRGFRLATNGAALTITVKADTDTNNLDHVAHYLTADGHALTLRRTGGDFALALTAASTLIIALYATYSVGATTTAELRSYTLAEYNALTASARNELIVLGTVVTPGAGVIPAANISHYRRTWAWSQLGQDSAPWLRLHDDPSFEYLTLQTPVVSGQAAHWYIAESSGNASWSVTTTDPSGENALTLTQSAAAALDPRLWQNIDAPVQPGQAVRARLSFKNLQISSAGTLQLSAIFADSSGTPIAATDPYTIDTSAVDATYRTIDNVFTAPTNAATLLRVQLRSNAADIQYPANAAVFRVNDFQAWLEPLGVLNNAKGNDPGARRLMTDMIRFVLGGAGAVPAASDAYLQQSAVGKVTLGRADSLEDVSHVPPTFEGRGNLSVGAGLASDDTGRILTRGTATARVLVWEGTTTSIATYKARIYQDAVGNFEFTLNARWDSGTVLWNRDVAGGPGMKLNFNITSINQPNPTGISLVYKSGVATWADTAWSTDTGLGCDLDGTNNPYLQVGASNVSTQNPYLYISGAGGAGGGLGPRLIIDKSNPSATAAIQKNTLYSKNIIKAWGRVASDGIGGVSIVDGFGLTSVAASGNDFLITLVNAVSVADRTVVVAMAQADTPTVLMSRLATGSASTFKLHAVLSDTAAAYNLNGLVATTVDFIVMGAQT